MGQVQREGEVVHLIARRLEDRTARSEGSGRVSRHFCSLMLVPNRSHCVSGVLSDPATSKSKLLA